MLRRLVPNPSRCCTGKYFGSRLRQLLIELRGFRPGHYDILDKRSIEALPLNLS